MKICKNLRRERKFIIDYHWSQSEYLQVDKVRLLSVFDGLLEHLRGPDCMCVFRTVLVVVFSWHVNDTRAQTAALTGFQ